MELRTPTSCGRNTRPASSTGAPRPISSPRLPTFLPGDITISAPIQPGVAPGAVVGSAAAHSAGSTASVPGGIGAPVITRTAWPSKTDPSNGRPGIESPITTIGRTLYVLAPSVEVATKA